MGLKIVKKFDASFTLTPEGQEILFDLLKNENFLQQISEQLKGSGNKFPTLDKIEFTGLLFQPVPYSLETPKGMPSEFEDYYNSENYIIINVPPNFMFKAKIFKPSRLCAIYLKKS